MEERVTTQVIRSVAIQFKCPTVLLALQARKGRFRTLTSVQLNTTFGEKRRAGLTYRAWNFVTLIAEKTNATRCEGQREKGKPMESENLRLPFLLRRQILKMT
jgi:hypothetical protein